jgi:hypothetical protein
MTIQDIIRQKKDELVDWKRKRSKEELVNQNERLKQLKEEREQLILELESRQNSTATKQEIRDMKRQNFQLKHPYISRFLENAKDRARESRKKGVFGYE